MENLDPEYQAIIKGQTSKKRKRSFVRSANIEKIRHKMELNMKYMLFGMKDKIDKPNIWQQEGFESSDCGEDNDDKEQAAAEKEQDEEDQYEEDFEYYDEEAEDEQEEEKGLDPSKMIKDEKVPKEEREMMDSMSAIEKKIVAQAEAKVEKKKAEEKKES